MRKIIINLAVLAVCVVCSAGLFGCDSVNRMSDFVDNVRPSAHFSTIELRLHGDTLHYYRVRRPQSLGR